MSLSSSPITAANNQKSDGEPNVKTFRFEFNKDFIAELSRFSKVHQFDERRTYKEEWQKWKMNPEIDEVVTKEIRRLEECGYKGDIEDKMFKSGRYYFRKKVISTYDNNNNNNNNNNAITDTDAATETDTANPQQQSSSSIIVSTDTSTSDNKNTTNPSKKKQMQRRPYITMSKSCIRMMDTHIKTNSTNVDFKPSTSYDLFYQDKMSTPEMMGEIEVIVEKFEKTIQKSAVDSMMSTTANVVVKQVPMMPSLESIMLEIMDKIKKTYKNRYYRFVNK